MTNSFSITASVTWSGCKVYVDVLDLTGCLFYSSIYCSMALNGTEKYNVLIFNEKNKKKSSARKFKTQNHEDLEIKPSFLIEENVWVWGTCGVSPMWHSPHHCRSLPEAGWGSETDRDPGKQCPRGRHLESQPCPQTPHNLDRPGSRCCTWTPSRLPALLGAARLDSERPAGTKWTTVSVRIFFKANFWTFTRLILSAIGYSALKPSCKPGLSLYRIWNSDLSHMEVLQI